MLIWNTGSHLFASCQGLRNRLVVTERSRMDCSRRCIRSCFGADMAGKRRSEAKQMECDCCGGVSVLALSISSKLTCPSADIFGTLIRSQHVLQGRRPRSKMRSCSPQSHMQCEVGCPDAAELSSGSQLTFGQGHGFVWPCLLALATHSQLYPIALLAPLLLLDATRSRRASGDVLRPAAICFVALAALTFGSRAWLGSWSFMRDTWVAM